MKELPTPPEVARQEVMNTGVGTLYDRLLQLSQEADKQVPDEMGRNFSDFDITFANKAIVRIGRVSRDYLNTAPWPTPYSGPEFHIHGRSTTLNRVLGWIHRRKMPPGHYTLTVNYPENSQTPQAYLTSGSNWLERQPVDIRLIKEIQTLLSGDVLKIRDASKVDEEELPEYVRAIRRSFRAYDQTKEQIATVLAGLDPTTNAEHQAVQENLALQTRDQVLAILKTLVSPNIRDLYILNTGFKKIPSAIPGAFARRTEKDIGEKRKLFLLQDGRLIKVPPRPRIIEAVTDKFDPDFNRANDAELAYWLDTDPIVSTIRDMLPYDIRDLTQKK